MKVEQNTDDCFRAFLKCVHFVFVFISQNLHRAYTSFRYHTDIAVP